jgi:hypothetical protein
MRSKLTEKGSVRSGARPVLTGGRIPGRRTKGAADRRTPTAVSNGRSWRRARIEDDSGADDRNWWPARLVPTCLCRVVAGASRAAGRRRQGITEANA